MNRTSGVASLTALMVAACSTSSPPPSPPTGIAADLARDITVLASDRFEGRKPGTRGEDSTVAYLVARFRELGIAPGNPDGTWVQNVPLLAVRSEPTVTLTIGSEVLRLNVPGDIVARSLLERDRVTLEKSGLVFAGYGIEAPEYGWNDYEGVDVRDKTVVVLLGEPTRRLATDSQAVDTTFFKGLEQTFHATPRAKRDLALSKGAAAIILVYGVDNVGSYAAASSGYQTEAFDIATPGRSVLPVTAAMAADRLRQFLARANENLDTLTQRARQPGFHAVPLPLAASVDIVMHSRVIQSHNVVGKLEGSDPRLRNEYVVFSAHWDAFGRDSTRFGDQIRNGAIDNAGGVSQVLAIAKAFKEMPAPPRRSILFLLTTAEEAGLLGARYYAEHPLYPIQRTVADVNFDNFFAWGRTADVINYGDGRSELDDWLRDAAEAQGRHVVPDPFPAEGFYFRMDQLELANVGVPSISPSTGIEVIGKPPGYGKARVDQYLNHDYHRFSDEIRPDWDYGGAVQDVELGVLLGKRLADDEHHPAWKPGAEFKARREADLKRAGHFRQR